MKEMELGQLVRELDRKLEDALRTAPPLPDSSNEAREPLIRYVLANAAGCRLAIGIDSLAEVGPLPPLTGLPNLPSWIQGIVNVRGEVVSVIDLPGFLHWQNGVEAGGDRFAVLRHGQRKVALRLDSIDGAVARALSDRMPAGLPDSDLERRLFSYMLQVDEQSYRILDTAEFLKADRLLNYSQDI